MDKITTTQKRRLITILNWGGIVIALVSSLLLLDWPSVFSWLWILVGAYSSIISFRSFLKIVRQRRWIRAGLLVLVVIGSLGVVALGVLGLYLIVHPPPFMPFVPIVF